MRAPAAQNEDSGRRGRHVFEEFPAIGYGPHGRRSFDGGAAVPRPMQNTSWGKLRVVKI